MDTYVLVYFRIWKTYEKRTVAEGGLAFRAGPLIGRLIVCSSGQPLLIEWMIFCSPGQPLLIGWMIFCSPGQPLLTGRLIFYSPGPRPLTHLPILRSPGQRPLMGAADPQYPAASPVRVRGSFAP